MSKGKKVRNTFKAIQDPQRIVCVRTILADELYGHVHVAATMHFNIIGHACHCEFLHVFPNVVLLADTTTGFRLFSSFSLAKVSLLENISLNDSSSR